VGEVWPIDHATHRLSDVVLATFTPKHVLQIGAAAEQGGDPQVE